MDSPPFGEKISFLEIIIHPEVNPSRLLGVLSNKLSNTRVSIG